jgi:hypothetical protein
MMVECADKFLLNSLNEFFEEGDHRQVMSNILKNRTLSLRVLDWYVSNYSKKRNIFFLSKEGKHFNIYLEYKASLKSYSKKYFDPFCRGPRVQFKDHTGKEFSTTVAQLNFFRWAIKSGVVDECSKIVDVVENDMITSVKRRKVAEHDDSRRELSKAKVKSCLVSNVLSRITISFN